MSFFRLLVQKPQNQFADPTSQFQCVFKVKAKSLIDIPTFHLRARVGKGGLEGSFVQRFSV